MSGPKPPGSGTGESGGDPSASGEASDGLGQAGGQTPSPGETEAYSQAYSAPESEQFSSGPYIPVDPGLYDYDAFDDIDEPEAEPRPPRWPWIVGVTTIVAAVALVVSVALLFVRTETEDLATEDTTTTTASVPPFQDEITTTPVAPPPPTSEEPEPPPPPSEPVEPPPPVEEPPPETTTPPPAATTTVAAPRQITYSVTGTKAPFDQITITYIDSSGQRRTQRNAYIPWSLTLTPISQSEVGSVEASSMLRLSRLNCSITSSDGTVLSSNSNDAPQTSC